MADETNRLRYTVKRDEAIRSLGITPKQLRTWQERGLFRPELGEGARGFTERDVERLRFITRLLDEDGIGLSLAMAQRLLAAHRPLPDHPGEVLAFLSLLREPELMTREDVFARVFDWMATNAINDKWGAVEAIEFWMNKLVALRFWVIETRDVPRFRRESEDIMHRLQSVERGCRVRRGYDRVGSAYDRAGSAEWRLEPTLPDDPDLSQQDLEALFWESVSLLGEFGRGGEGSAREG